MNAQQCSLENQVVYYTAKYILIGCLILALGLITWEYYFPWVR